MMPEHPDPTGRLDALLAQLVEETIDADGLAELETVLDGNPAAQRRYLGYLGLHAELQEHASAAPVNFAPSRGLWRRALLGAAAAVVVAAAMFFWPRSETQIARVVDFDGAVQWTGAGGEVVHHLVVDRMLGGGTLEALAADSWVELQFLDGSEITVSGRSILTISDGDDGKVLHLREGKLSARVNAQPSGKPLRVITATAEAEVIGTQFNVEANAFSTQLAVNEGRVRVKRLVDGSVKEVPADHSVIAKLDQAADLQVVPRSGDTNQWQSDLPLDILNGDWRDGQNGKPGSLLATPVLWRGDRGEKKEPVLLYVASIEGSNCDEPAVVLSEESRFRVRGRVNSMKDVDVILGLTLLHPRGGFAGKYQATLDASTHFPGGGEFVVEVPVQDFHAQCPRHPQSASCLILHDLWCLTVRDNINLELISVELF